MKLPVSLRRVSQELQPATGVPILTIPDPNAMTQVVGWLKFRTRSEMVVLRGQASLFRDMMAGGFRPGAKQSSIGKVGRERLAAAMNRYLTELAGECVCRVGKNSFGRAHRCVEQVIDPSSRESPIVQGTYRATLEPLLQHYGLRTRWLDVVDNVWIALWFACHVQQSDGRHAFHLRRSVAQEGLDSFAYVAILRTGEVGRTHIPGYLVGAETRLVDLRYAVPSVYLRPHAQHGLLLAPSQLGAGSTGSLISQTLAYLRVRLVDALDWLGEGAMTSPHVLFPPASRDEGFRRLLDSSRRPPAHLGHVTLYGPGY